MNREIRTRELFSCTSDTKEQTSRLALLRQDDDRQGLLPFALAKKKQTVCPPAAPAVKGLASHSEITSVSSMREARLPKTSVFGRHLLSFIPLRRRVKSYRQVKSFGSTADGR
jgi:hypothetical protein